MMTNPNPKPAIRQDRMTIKHFIDGLLPKACKGEWIVPGHKPIITDDPEAKWAMEALIRGAEKRAEDRWRSDMNESTKEVQKLSEDKKWLIAGIVHITAQRDKALNEATAYALQSQLNVKYIRRLENEVNTLRLLINSAITSLDLLYRFVGPAAVNSATRRKIGHIIQQLREEEE